MIEPETPRPGGGPRDDAIDPASDALIADGFQIPDISASNDAAPPSYGDVMNELHLSQLGFEAGAAITCGCFFTRPCLSIPFPFHSPRHLAKQFIS